MLHRVSTAKLQLGSCLIQWFTIPSCKDQPCGSIKEQFCSCVSAALVTSSPFKNKFTETLQKLLKGKKTMAEASIAGI
jgi:hypothetical protein